MNREFSAKVEVGFETVGRAKAVESGIAADDDRFVATRREGKRLVVVIRAPDVPSLRRAVDDVLATLGVSEDVLAIGDMAE